ncbi:hypothetical protein J7J84_03675 [bacterium]|nr:hypothetical protein [bacterium]
MKGLLTKNQTVRAIAVTGIVLWCVLAVVAFTWVAVKWSKAFALIKSLEKPWEAATPDAVASEDRGLSGVFTVVPGMSRDECMEALCILNFWTRPGLFGGETWEFHSPYGEGIVLNFDSKDVLYLVSTGVRTDEDNRIKTNTPRPLISRLKLRWFMEKEKAISVMLSTGLFNGHPVREAGKYAVFSFSDVDVKLAFSDENLFTGIQLSDQEWEKMIE